ncbi:response regulator [Paenibacillus sp. GCM10012307]|uniref:Response regulator n=1 Tax=Paenibacillus roseus TaxID=2798579 RepID=A0A934IZS8_9BACL|nr:response regulator [Paenibacillus roseus]MBJ6362236.1 response regulator [Paenibacillus roseus]
MITAFMVDDEEHALTILELFLKKTGQVQVIGKSGNSFDALHQLEKLSPDVLFLDIEMPEMNGIELAEVIKSRTPNVSIVYLTAYDQYAITAFEQSALDYILKPLEMERLSKTINKIKRELELQNTISANNQQADEHMKAARLEIQLLGQMSMGIAGGEKIKWRISKERELLAYLALHGEVHKDKIIEDVWTDENYNKAKIYLHTCISLLRKHMKQLGFDNVLHYEEEKYFLDMSRIGLDISNFKAGLIRIRQQEYAAPEDIEEVLALYQGILLAEQDYLWVGQEAQILDQTAIQLRLLLTERWIEAGEYQRAAEMAEQIISHSPYDEEAYRLLMKAFHLRGKNDQALLTYNRLASRLEELLVNPSTLTHQLLESITSGSPSFPLQG